MTRAIIEGARKFDATSAFEAFYKLAALRRTTEAVWRAFDVMLVPTLPRLYTVAEVLADPVRLNSRLGTYTNFVNLLDLAAIAVPSGMRGDGLPSSVTLIAPAGADGLLAAMAACSSGALGCADGRDRPAAKPCGCAAGLGGPDRTGGRRRASGRPAAQPRADRTRRSFRARGRDDARLSVVRAAGNGPAQTRPAARRRRRGSRRSRRRSGRSTRPASAPSSPKSRRPWA